MRDLAGDHMWEWLSNVKHAVLDEGEIRAPEEKPQQAQNIPFDGFDLASLLVASALLHETGMPIGLFLAFGQYIVRRTPSEVFRKPIAELIKRARPLLTAVVPKRAILPPPTPTSVEVPPTVVKVAEESATLRAMRQLPSVVLVDALSLPESPTAVPLGINHLGLPVWADFQTELLHVGIYGTSGAGKDNLLRVWFAILAQHNPPYQLQWVFLDGKGDWLTSDLANLECMFIPPAGGYGKSGKEALLNAIRSVDKEAERRQAIIFSRNCRTREQYNKVYPDDPLPLLMVVASDVMDVVSGEIEELLTSLVSKARALGIRVIASMQTPTGKAMGWRMNLSSVFAGSLVDGSQDAPALGVREPRLLPFRPSELPPPPKEKGLFVARVGGEYMLIRTPVFAQDSTANEERFNAIVATLPKKNAQSVNNFSAENIFRPSVFSAENKSSGKYFPPHSDAIFRNFPLTTENVENAVKVWKMLDAENRKKAINALHLMEKGVGKHAAIEELFNVSSGRPYQRAAMFVDAAYTLRYFLRTHHPR